MARKETADSFKARPRKSGAGMLFFLAFALVAAGVGFAAAPHFSWQVTKVARIAADYGVQSGVLVLGGLGLFGLAIVARAAAAPAPEPESNPVEGQLQLINEQLSAKLGQLRTSLLQITEDVTAISAVQQTQFQKQGDAPDHQQDALFRLAASLDKLNAHIDERIHAVDLLLRSGFESMAAAMHDLRRTGGRVEPSLARAEVAPDPFATMPVPQHGPAHAPEGTIDFYEALQKLDAIAGDPRGGPPRGQAQPQHPQPPFMSQDSETLDALLPEDHRKRY
jgi:hypothetical protein